MRSGSDVSDQTRGKIVNAVCCLHWQQGLARMLRTRPVSTAPAILGATQFAGLCQAEGVTPELARCLPLATREGCPPQGKRALPPAE
jgi:hypothetical protein